MYYVRMCYCCIWYAMLCIMLECVIAVSGMLCIMLECVIAVSGLLIYSKISFLDA